MKTNQIKRAALAAAILAGVGVAYGAESALQVVYCKATIMGSDEGEQVVSVTIPPTDGYFDDNGNPLTFWNVGNVPAGGVADSWHQDGGPGRFTARNAGNVGAYFYVTTSGTWDYRRFDGTNMSGNSHVLPQISSTEAIFGQLSVYLQGATISPRELRTAETHADGLYHLAFTTDTMAKVPTWHSLDHRWMEVTWETYERDDDFQSEVAGYMGYVDAGDYLTFDLKFWAPVRQDGNALFTFGVEASSFPLWDHSRAVE